MTEQTYRLIVDMKQRRPACALLQAAYGGDYGVLGRFFDSRDWLTAPTPDMQPVSGTREQWMRLARLCREHPPGDFEGRGEGGKGPR
jgi:hypothetical protein